VAAIVKAERGEIHLPQEAPWLDECMTELAAFAGANDPQDDQVDCLAYSVLAANTFQAPACPQGPCVLIPPRGDCYAPDFFAGGRSTGALGYGAEGGPPPSAWRPLGAW
jgi:hypothetical protein